MIGIALDLDFSDELVDTFFIELRLLEWFEAEDHIGDKMTDEVDFSEAAWVDEFNHLECLYFWGKM